jgi:hypothetical protein
LIEALQLEIGSRNNPLNEDFLEHGQLATDCWVKAVWEQACFHKFRLDLGYVTCQFPRESDQKIMDIFLASNVKGKDLISLNRCRIAHEAIFLSCISTGEGTHIDQAFLGPPSHVERQFMWKFSRETPTDKEWALWVSFWGNQCNPRLRLPQIVGKWVTVSHRIWPWYHNKVKDVIYRQTTTTFFAYVLLVHNRTRAGNLYALLGETYTIPTRVVPVTTTQVEQDVVALQGPRPSVPSPYQVKALFWDKLAAAGGGWLWQQVSDKTLDTRWIAAALAKGTALISTDGSYSRKQAPHVCGTGWALAFRAAQRVITGSFPKFSCDASSY